jgi:integrase/recombinase XerD
VQDLDIAALLPSWQLSLRAERKSPRTVKVYGDGVRLFLAWCDSPNGELSRANVSAWVAHLLDQGNAAATARTRLLAVRRFSAWLTEEGEQSVDPLLGIRAPKLDRQVVQPLTDNQLRAMLKACSGTGFRDRRDEAILRLAIETGARAGELAVLEIADLDLIGGTAVIRRGKGAKGRIVPYSPLAARAIDRYVRIRRIHKLAATPALWLGDRNRAFTYEGLYKTLKWRAELAGVPDFFPHQLRHTAAHRWLAAGGSESGLLAVAGWSSSAMLQRYTQAQASSRAADEARTLGLGDL